MAQGSGRTTPGGTPAPAHDAVAARVTPLGHEPTLAASGGPEPGEATPMSPARLARLTARLPQVGRDVYTLGSEVAQGGIGRVLRARDERLDRPVAIKELLTWTPRQEQRFVREALLTARLQHPAIVPIYEAGRWPDGEPFYAMKLVSGRSLADLIAERATFAERLALLPHVLTAAQAVAYAHSKQIIHRDLKPANVLVGEFGETVVIDWGLAKAIGEDDPVGEAGTSAGQGQGLTIQGAVVGTPSYMPPEQAAGAAVDERADVYALGAMLYHLLAAVSPYDDAPWERLLATIVAEPPRPLEALVPQLSDELAAIVNKAMAREPAARYPTAKALADDLERFQAGQIVAAHTYSLRQLLRRYWRRNRQALSVAAAAVVLLAIVVLLAFIRTDRERRFAESQQRDAVAARLAAEQAGKQATARADGMTLLQAQDALRRDPNRALAWLKTLSAEFTDARTVRRLAADAHARGISRAFHGHSEYVNRFVVSPDGAHFVTVSDDKTGRVWELATGASVVLAGHSDEIWSVQISPDGDEVTTGSKDSTLRTWDAHTGAARMVLPVPAPTRQLVMRADGVLLGGNTTAAPWLRRPGAAAVELLTTPGETPRWAHFSADGQHLIVQPEGGDAYVRTLMSDERRTLPGTREVAGRWFLDPHAAVAVQLSEASVELWELATLTRRRLAFGSQSRRPMFSARGDLVAFAVGADIHIHDLRSGAQVHRLVGHEGPVQAIAFAEDDRSVVSGAIDRTVRSWDLETGDSEVHAGFEGIVTEVGLLADGRSILATSATGEVRLFATRRAGQVVTHHPAPASGLALATDGRVASIDDQGRLRVSDLEGRAIGEHVVPGASGSRLLAAPDGRSFAGVTHAWIVQVDGRFPDREAAPATLLFAEFTAAAPRQVPLPAAALELAWLPDSSGVLVALIDGSVRRVDRSGGARELVRFTAPATSVAVAPGGEFAAAGSEAGELRLLALTTGRHRVLTPHTQRITGLAFSSGDPWLASGSADHTIRLWRAADDSFRAFDEGGHGVEQLAFTPDGRELILLSGGETQLRRLDVASGAHKDPLVGPLGKLHGFTLAGDGRRLLTLGADGAVRLIDTRDGEGRTLARHTRAVAAAGFAADGRVIVTLGREGSVRAWPDDLPETMPELRAWLDAATPERIRGR